MKWIKKTQISMQTFFMILMGIFFVWILIFGYNQIINVKTQISDQEKLFLKNEIKDALEYCNEPLNKGSSKVFEFKSKEFNGICLIGDNNFDTSYGSLGATLNGFKTAKVKENVYLIQAVGSKDPATGKYTIKSYKIVDKMYADFGNQSSKCSFQEVVFTCN